MKRRIAAVVSGAFLCLGLCSLPLSVGAEPITKVDIELTDSGGATGAALLARMSKSMQVVAEQLLLERDTTQIQPVVGDYTRLLSEVGDRVLTGYQMEKITLDLGTVTKVQIKVSPWSSTIQNVEIDLQFSGIDQSAGTLLLTKLPQLRADIASTLQGASIDAADWAGGVLRTLIRQEVAKALPEFKAAVDLVRTEEKVIVQVIIYPVGQTVQDIDFQISSETVPNVLFIDFKEKIKQHTEELRGLPVEYVKNNLATLEAKLLADVAAEKVVKLYELKPKVKIVPGTKTLVEMQIEADKYKIWFEGYGDIGRKEENFSGKAHLGKFISPRDEIFVEASVKLNKVAWEFAPGISHRHGKTIFSYARLISAKENDYRIEYKFSPKWQLRTERFSGEQVTEFGVRYRIHEFLSVEYVYSNKESYLRLIGNL